MKEQRKEKKRKEKKRKEKKRKEKKRKGKRNKETEAVKALTDGGRLVVHLHILLIQFP